MKSSVRIVADSLYPKRHLDKTFEIEMRCIDGSVIFKWKNIQQIGKMRFFVLEKYRFVSKLTDYYVDGV